MGHAYKSNLKNLDRLLIQHLESERETENAALQLPDKARPHLCPIPPRHRSLLHLRQPVTHEGGGEECTRTQFIHMLAQLGVHRQPLPLSNAPLDFSINFENDEPCYLQPLSASKGTPAVLGCFFTFPAGPFDVNWGRVCSPLDLSLIQEYKMAGRYIQ
ncbi:unnamed protein product [Fusarium graminearum]|nr:unnamed protein product [Fusarium graminearum]VTO89261.1 unnamed protein product [Fusarium graminearum]